MKLNKKGSVVVELVISIFIFTLSVILLTNFKSFLTMRTVNIKNQMTFYINIENELSHIYTSSDWDNLEQYYEKDIGDVLKVEIQDFGISEFNTEIKKVTFTFKDLQETFYIERSMYYG